MLKAGTEIEVLSREPISAQQLRDYANASGDQNPIHLDEEAARKVGLPGVIAHGMLVAGMMAERAQQFMKEKYGSAFQLKQFQSRFKAMALLGDVPSIGGVIKSMDSNEVTLDLFVKNQRGETTATGVARYSVKE